MRTTDRPPVKGPKRFVYTFVTTEALASVKRRVKTLTKRSTIRLDLAELLRALDPVLRGWTAYFRYAAAKRTFAYRRSVCLVAGHPLASQEAPAVDVAAGQATLLRQGCHPGGRVTLYDPAAVRVERYRLPARISTPWNEATLDAMGGR